MRIKTVTIENFRSIKNATIHLNEITALVGENNAGKTAILRALNSVFNFPFEKEFFFNNMHRYWTRTITKITVVFDEIPDKEIYQNKTIGAELQLRFQYSYSNSKNGRTLSCLTENGKQNVDEDFIDELKHDIDFIYIPANRGTKDLQWNESSILARTVKRYLQEYTKNRDLLSNQAIRAAKTVHTQALTRLEYLFLILVDPLSAYEMISGDIPFCLSSSLLDFLYRFVRAIEFALSHSSFLQ